jgi:primary-amine oxidase
MDALTAREYWTVFEVLKGSGRVNADTRFPEIGLREPPKAAVLARTKGQPLRREARVVVRQGRSVFVAVVDISGRKLASWNEVEGVQAAATEEEDAAIGDLAKANAEWQAAMRLRGITDFETVDCWGAVLGHFGTEPERGRRLARAICSEGRGGYNSQFRPIEGVVVLVDLDERTVVRVIDTGVRPVPKSAGDYDAASIGPPREVPGPLLLQQPLGPGFRLDAGEITWQNWRFHFRIDPRQGTVVSNVKYEDAGRWRDVLYQGALTEIFVPYMDPDEGWYFASYLDIGESITGLAKPLEKGGDCPDHALYFDSVHADERGIPRMRPRTACLFEREPGDPAWRHGTSSHVESRRRRDLVLRMVATIGNYDYVVDWVFQQDGSLRVVAGATGMVVVKAVTQRTATDPAGGPSGSSTRPDAHGRFVAENTVAINHDHFLSFRLDLDVDGPTNSVVVDRLVPERLPAGSPRRSLWRIESSTLHSEKEGRLDMGMEHPALWRVVNPKSLGPNGYPASFQVKPGHTETSLLAPDDNPQLRAGFSAHSLWVTRHDDGEKLAAGPFPTGASGAGGLPLWSRADRSLENADLVVWYTMGMHHVVRAEDWPVMPVVWHDLELRPFDFFGRNPALDLPK